MSIMKGKLYDSLLSILGSMRSGCKGRLNTLDPQGNCAAVIKSINQKNEKIRRKTYYKQVRNQDQACQRCRISDTCKIIIE